MVASSHGEQPLRTPSVRPPDRLAECPPLRQTRGSAVSGQSWLSHGRNTCHQQSRAKSQKIFEGTEAPAANRETSKHVESMSLSLGAGLVADCEVALAQPDVVTPQQQPRNTRSSCQAGWIAFAQSFAVSWRLSPAAGAHSDNNSKLALWQALPRKKNQNWVRCFSSAVGHGVPAFLSLRQIDSRRLNLRGVARSDAARAIGELVSSDRATSWLFSHRAKVPQQERKRACEFPRWCDKTDTQFGVCFGTQLCGTAPLHSSMALYGSPWQWTRRNAEGTLDSRLFTASR